LTWIDNLQTGRDSNNGTNDLANPKHPHHKQDYVQNWLAEYGPRKVEANAIVVVPEMGRELCQAAIEDYLTDDAIESHQQHLEAEREKVHGHVLRLLKEMKG
jgi:hypothetical protein